VQLVDGQLILSASDLINFLECEHLTYLDREVASGRLQLDATRTDSADLIATKGDEHERAHLQSLLDDGRDVVSISTEPGLDGLRRAATTTEAAMRAGTDVIYQAVLFDGERWRGYADFLERVERPSALGAWSYEVADTKLARTAKPYFVMQLCFYSELVGAVQGVPPEQMHVILGSKERASFRFADFAAYYRRIKSHFEDTVDRGLTDTYPDPVAHCGLCRWSGTCDKQRVDDDHLSLVARIGRPQIARLVERDVSTVGELAALGREDRPPRIAVGTFDRLRQQARLQVNQRETGKHSSELLPPEPERGFALLPEPCDGDVFFDIEGDPFFEDGLEYLFGVVHAEDGEIRFKDFWGRDRAEEKQAFEAFIDWLMQRRAEHPALHVYHYAHYEPTALQRLMGLHATREDEVDELLRGGVLVDLYRVVEQSLRISQPSYSIKKVEAFYMPERDASITDGEDSIIKFEEWLDSGDDSLLQWIRDYNEEDCVSTYKLREWLLARREDAIRKYGDIPWRGLGDGTPGEDQQQDLEEVAQLRASLIDGVPEERADRSSEQHARWMLSALLDYHRREAKPSWWEYFERLKKSEEELVELDAEAIAGLEVVGEPTPLPPPRRSVIHSLQFPPQEHRIGIGEYVDPFTGNSYNVARVIDDAGVLEITRGTAKEGQPLPRALIPPEPIRTTAQRKALREIAEHVLADGIDAVGPYHSARDVLLRAFPRTSAVAPGTALQGQSAELEDIKHIVRGLDGSYLFIQGPPGSGKTYTGAQLILDLLGRGYRVGAASTSHKAINNLLREVESLAHELNVDFRGLKKSGAADTEFVSDHDQPLIDNAYDNASFPTPAGVDLMAGTTWLWSREQMRESLDYLIIDEAGQVSLADALAMATATSNLVLLGDPLQLAQVSRGGHPDGTGCSVLEHLLGDHATIPPDRGVFLDSTRRMHPAVSRFVSDAVYDGRLHSIPECAVQRIEFNGTEEVGVRRHLVAHSGNARLSPEEADLIAAEIARLVGSSYTQSDGVTRELRPSDFMVVTPYNAQVRCLRSKLSEAVRVGTVDKFQGQEAPVVFFSMATSSGEEIPRNVEFLYSRNRLNVAVSRAKCLAVLVASPRLLTIGCRSVDQMRLLNALCLLVETADEQTGARVAT
jgi:predicted RecB family nuclease